ncbi:MAG TPA: hypothetical protein PLN85_00565 [archaeon]|jgi:hypothetical protein|nr:hypothetical protein [archaeon]
MKTQQRVYEISGYAWGGFKNQKLLKFITASTKKEAIKKSGFLNVSFAKWRKDINPNDKILSTMYNMNY